MPWNYLQVEVADTVLHPVVGPGGLSRAEAHAVVRRLLSLFIETAPYADGLVEEWDAGAADDTAYAGALLWAIYEADDPLEGAREWVEDLARTLRSSGSTVRIAW